MKESLIILGAGVMQGPAIKIAKELGYYAVVLDGSKDAPCIPSADRFEQIDLKNKEDIESFARSLQSRFSRIGIMTAGTDFSASVAWTAEKLGLPGIPYEAALNASDKSRMRGCFSKAGLPSPEYLTITNEDISIWETGSGKRGAFFVRNQIVNNNSPTLSPLTANRFPLVIKPVDNMGSRGCRRVDAPGELHEAAKTALGFSRSGRAIIESYMEGPEFSVDAVICHGEITICGLADRHIFFPPYFIEMGHTMPTKESEENQKLILDVFCEGVRALGLAGVNRVGAAKGDIKLTTNESGSPSPMLGEIAARLSGGYMSGWTYPYSSGVQPIKAAILLAMGKDPFPLEQVKKRTSAERAFISIPGTVKEVGRRKEKGGGDEDVSSLLKVEFVNDIFLRVKPGDKVSFPENNVSKCGNVIATAPKREDAVNAAETATKSILIKLDPSDRDTEEFLISDTTFPPSAFDITLEIKTALCKIPEGDEGRGTRDKTVNSTSPVPCPLSLVPFPEFTESLLTDYMGRTVKETLEAVRQLTGLPLQFAGENAENVVENTVVLGRSFWKAFIRGAYQGAVYFIESIFGEKIDKETS